MRPPWRSCAGATIAPVRSCSPAKWHRRSPNTRNMVGSCLRLRRATIWYTRRDCSIGTAEASKIDLSDVDAFAATSGPGLASSLMVGASIAKGLAIGFGKPYLAINHLEGHLLSPFFSGADGEAGIRPNVSLIVSGGHTMLVRVTRAVRLSGDRPHGRRRCRRGVR